jgi:hypothetical protein
MLRKQFIYRSNMASFHLILVATFYDPCDLLLITLILGMGVYGGGERFQHSKVGKGGKGGLRQVILVVIKK